MQPRSEHIVQDLARRARCTVEEASAAYEAELARLRSWAEVEQYVAVIASRRALEHLRKH